MSEQLKSSNNHDNQNAPKAETDELAERFGAIVRQALIGNNGPVGRRKRILAWYVAGLRQAVDRSQDTGRFLNRLAVAPVRRNLGEEIG
ncbi:MAG: hypothetical protein KDI02_03075, partial [Anaerolineae bacterium]|nr:hypothetical protein [Anaerolineae bacterium]